MQTRPARAVTPCCASTVRSSLVAYCTPATSNWSKPHVADPGTDLCSVVPTPGSGGTVSIFRAGSSECPLLRHSTFHASHPHIRRRPYPRWLFPRSCTALEPDYLHLVAAFGLLYGYLRSGPCAVVPEVMIRCRRRPGWPTDTLSIDLISSPVVAAPRTVEIGISIPNRPRLPRGSAAVDDDRSRFAAVWSPPAGRALSRPISVRARTGPALDARAAAPFARLLVRTQPDHHAAPRPPSPTAHISPFAVRAICGNVPPRSASDRRLPSRPPPGGGPYESAATFPRGRGRRTRSGFPISLRDRPRPPRREAERITRRPSSELRCGRPAPPRSRMAASRRGLPAGGPARRPVYLPYRPCRLDPGVAAARRAARHTGTSRAHDPAHLRRDDRGERSGRGPVGPGLDPRPPRRPDGAPLPNLSQRARVLVKRPASSARSPRTCPDGSRALLLYARRNAISRPSSPARTAARSALRRGTS